MSHAESRNLHKIENLLPRSSSFDTFPLALLILFWCDTLSLLLIALTRKKEPRLLFLHVTKTLTATHCSMCLIISMICDKLCEFKARRDDNGRFRGGKISLLAMNGARAEVGRGWKSRKNTIHARVCMPAFYMLLRDDAAMSESAEEDEEKKVKQFFLSFILSLCASVFVYMKSFGIFYSSSVFFEAKANSALVFYAHRRRCWLSIHTIWMYCQAPEILCSHVSDKKIGNILGEWQRQQQRQQQHTKRMCWIKI